MTVMATTNTRSTLLLLFAFVSLLASPSNSQQLRATVEEAEELEMHTQEQRRGHNNIVLEVASGMNEEDNSRVGSFTTRNAVLSNQDTRTSFTTSTSATVEASRSRLQADPDSKCTETYKKNPTCKNPVIASIDSAC